MAVSAVSGRMSCLRGMDHRRLPRFVTVPEAARRLGLGLPQLRRAIRRGEITPVMTHPTGWPRLDLAEVEAWARSLPRRGDLAHIGRGVAAVVDEVVVIDDESAAGGNQ